MSASFNAVTGGFFGWSMRNASSILFWGTLAVFFLTVASYATLLFRSEADQTDTPTRVNTILNVLVISLNNAAWPFIGAAVVWTLQNRSKEVAE